MPMAAIHVHTQTDKFTSGRTNMAAQMRNTRSATLSILEPSSSAAFNFLARGPSIMSETPHQQYSIQNPGLKTGNNNSIVSAATPLEADNILGRNFK